MTEAAITESAQARSSEPLGSSWRCLARGGSRGTAALRRRRRARLYAPSSRSRLHLSRLEGRRGQGRRPEAPLRRAGDPSGLDRGVDLPLRQRSHPGHRTRSSRAQAVPLSPALARGARSLEVRPHDRVRSRPAEDPRARRRRSRAGRPAAREGPRRGGATARDLARPRGQRRVRAAQRLVRAHHAAQEARRAQRRPRGARARIRRARAASRGGSRSPIRAWSR